MCHQVYTHDYTMNTKRDVKKVEEVEEVEDIEDIEDDEYCWKRTLDDMKNHDMPEWCIGTTTIKPTSGSYYKITHACFVDVHGGYCSWYEDFETEQTDDVIIYLPIEKGQVWDIQVDDDWSIPNDDHHCCGAELSWQVTDCVKETIE